MSEESEVIYVAGMAKMLGKTEAAVRDGIRRAAPWLPKGFKVGTQHAWLREDVRQFLRGCRDGENKPVKVGRKRQVPPTLRQVS
ncbi:hypothetical protein [Pseudomonas xionganensis]|uniref:DNA-binding protein n=1 Tax=Pseudomonas xionganensis TaxID=2654845 RepID=A0A6I4KXW5_9PSED|nr:hypothetical protein [Pseudomonas xionganensis]MVW75346.1 hypothetical protein [Pseudomonas xionganensis]